MNPDTGASSGSLFGAPTEELTEELGTQAPILGCSVAQLNPYEAAERVASSWVDSIDEALGRAREQLAGEFSIWKRASQIATPELGPRGLAAAVEEALSLAIEVAKMEQAVVLRPVGPGGCGRITHHLGITEAVAAAVEGFANAGQAIVSRSLEVFVADLEADGAPEGTLLRPRSSPRACGRWCASRSGARVERMRAPCCCSRRRPEA